MTVESVDFVPFYDLPMIPTINDPLGSHAGWPLSRPIRTVQRVYSNEAEDSMEVETEVVVSLVPLTFPPNYIPFINVVVSDSVTPGG